MNRTLYLFSAGGLGLNMLVGSRQKNMRAFFLNKVQDWEFLPGEYIQTELSGSLIENTADERPFQATEFRSGLWT